MSAFDVITERGLILRSADRWKKQYGPKWSKTISGSSLAAYRRLRRLDLKTCSSRDVSFAIDQGEFGEDYLSTFVTEMCDGCSKESQFGIRFYSQHDITPFICKECLNKGVRALRGLK